MPTISVRATPLVLAFLALVFLLIAIAPATTSAGTYYVDATGGDDGNSGTATDQAWQTVSRVNASSFSPGDQILFNRGEVWRGTLTPPSSGSAGNPITFGTYGSGERPVISGADIISGWTEASGSQVAAQRATKTFKSQNVGRDASNNNWALEWTATETLTVTQITAWLSQLGTISGGTTFGFEIWDDDSGSPGSVIANGVSSAIDPSTITTNDTTGAACTFTFATPPTLTQGNTYYFVTTFDFPLSTSNYLHWWGVNAGVSGWQGWRIYTNGTEDDMATNTPYLQIFKPLENVWEATVATQPRVVLFDGVYGTQQTSADEVGSANEWHWASSTLKVYSTTDPDSNPVVEAAQRNRALLSSAKSYLTFEDLEFATANEYTIFLSGAQSHNTFRRVVMRNGFEFNIVAQAAASQTDILLEDTESYRAGSTGYKIGPDTARWTLRTCTSDHDGIVDEAFDSGSGEQAFGAGIGFVGVGVTNVLSHLVENCTVTNAGKKDDGSAVTAAAKGFGIWFDMLRPVSAADGSVMRYNDTHENALSGLFVEKTQHAAIYNNLSYANGQYGLRVDADDDDLVNDNLFSNNTLFGNSVNLYGAGGFLQTGMSFQRNTFKNNLTSGASTREVELKWGAQNDRINGEDNVYEHNIFDEGTSFLRWQSTDYATVAAWEGAVTGAAENVGSDPLLTDPGSVDFSPQLTSPAIDAGTTTALHTATSTDYLGNPIYGTPDIGALEYQPRTRSVPTIRVQPVHRTPER